MLSAASRTFVGLCVALVLAVAAALWAWSTLVSAQAELVAAQEVLAKAEADVAAAQAALVLAKATANAEKEAAVRAATQKEKWKQKAAGKGKRLAAAVPVVGAAVTVWFEEREYREWREEHRAIEGEIEARRTYYMEIYTICMQVIEEEFGDLKTKSPESFAKLKKAVEDWYRNTNASLAS